MPRSLLVPARACHRCGVSRWAMILLLSCIMVIATALSAVAAQIVNLNSAKISPNPSDYSQTGPRREFRSSLSTMYTQVDTFCVRYASVLAVDVASGGNTESEGVTSAFQVTFKVLVDANEPKDWTIKLWSYRRGELTVIDDNGGRATAQINGSTTATSNTGNSLATLQFGTQSSSNNGNPAGDKHDALTNTGPAWALLTGTGTMDAVSYTHLTPPT